MTDQQVIERLKKLQDIEYQKFHSKIVVGNENMIGIPMPKLRTLAKELVLENPQEYLDNCSHEYYEQTMLYGLILGQVKFDVETVIFYLEKLLPAIDNWAVCDSTAMNLKIVAKNKERFLEFIKRHITSENPFAVRFSVCLLMDYYVTDEYIDQTLTFFKSIQNDHYYIKMAVAWGMCECLIKQYEKAIGVIENRELPLWTHNKTIRKAIESFRITKEQKQALRSQKL